MVSTLDTGTAGEGVAFDPCYVGWFSCFNEGRYYEAHDVLEHLWLRSRDANHAFFKGLIQFAGAFVHLRKNYERPQHPKDRSRLRPAARLFQLAAQNLAPYGHTHLRLDVRALRERCAALIAAIEASGFARNPWNPANAPRIELAG